ncbi:MAG: hypothetical protein SFW07_05230 [Gammaproteobacteria bacterium]|nr:hypothetical protein [Gammaproteobacteria bacterium]
MVQDELFSDLVARDEIYAYLMLILKHFASITIYTIEPYITQNDDVLTIPAGENYNIHDYGGRLVVAPIDVYATPFFSSSGLLNATDQAIEMLIDAGVKEIAVLGAACAKDFTWDKLKRLEESENIILKLINYHPTEAFEKRRDAAKRYLADQGLKLKARLKKTPQPNQRA